MAGLTAFVFQACNDEENTSTADENTKPDSVATGNTPDTSNQTTVQITGTPFIGADSSFVIKAASGGMMEVQLGQIAQEKAQNQRVKDFGAMMVRDHSKANDELKALAASRNFSLPSALLPEHQKHVDHMKGMSGKEFDKHYMKMMVDDHAKDVREFEKTSNNAQDAELKSFASKTLPTLKTHSDSAKAINKIKF